jgi:hypothetical protein
MSARIYRLYPDGIAHPCRSQHPTPAPERQPPYHRQERPAPPRVVERDRPFVPPPVSAPKDRGREIIAGTAFAVVCVLLIYVAPLVIEGLKH